MNLYDEFHGDIDVRDIGQELRKIVKKERKSFKIMTGHGSTCGISKSKNAALKSLKKMKQEGLIKGYFPGEIKQQLLANSSPYYEDKMLYSNIVKNDNDYGNDGIIFIFI